jgi:hypothetical protein
MITLTNKNEEDESEIKEGYYYWGYLNDTFKLIKITTVGQKEINYREGKIKYEYLNDGHGQVHLIDSSTESKMLTKDKNLLKKFDINQINPLSEDLANISSISYPSLLYNLKLKNEFDIHFTRAGKLLIGINYNKLKRSDIMNNAFLSKFLSSVADNFNFHNQTLIINGLPNTGKSNIMKSILSEFFSQGLSEHEKYNQILSNFHSNNEEEIKKNCLPNGEILNYLLDSIKFLELFGNTVETGSNSNMNSSRYMRVLKFQKLKNLTQGNKIVKIKIKHYLFEKSRILDSFNTSQSLEEKDDKDNKEIKNNFHIFHALICGLYMIFYKNLYSENESKYKEYDEILKIIKSECKELMENGILEELYNDYSEYFIEYQDYYLEKFSLLIELFKSLKIIHKKIIKKIFNVVLSVLVLLKIEFQVNEDGKAILDENNAYINLLSILLDCELNTIRTKLISREIRSPRGSFYVVKFTLEEANRTRDTFAKYLYENLFEYLTRFINTLINEEIRKEILQLSSQEEYFKSLKKLKQDNQLKTYLIVECFGFENSEDAMKNSLENLCVNYTNDKLNNLLFDMLIRGETELYKQEGILTDDLAMMAKLEKSKENNQQSQGQLADQTKTSSTPSSTRKSVTNANRPRGALKMNLNKNNGMLDMDIEETLLALDDQNKGIFKLIDVQGSLINTNKGAIKSLCDNIKLHWPNLLTTSSSFFLVHFGSVVEYGANDFILKNVDTVNQDLKEISNKFFKKFTKYLLTIQNYPKDPYAGYLLKIVTKDESKVTTSSQGRNSATRKMSQNFKLNSNTEKFLISLKKLLTDITNSNVNFIKLINSAVDIENYDDKFILKQIYSSGIFESIMLAKGGFYLRHNYEELFNKLIRYQIFFKDIVKEDHDNFINKFSQLLKIDSSDVIIGKTLIFIKNNAVEKNRSLLNCNYLPTYAINCALKNLLRKVVKVSRIIKFFRSVGKKGLIKNFTMTLQNIINNGHKRNFIFSLKEGFEVCLRKINLIIKVIRRYLNWKKIIRDNVYKFENRLSKSFLSYRKRSFINYLKQLFEYSVNSQILIKKSFLGYLHRKQFTKLRKTYKFLHTVHKAMNKNIKFSFFAELYLIRYKQLSANTMYLSLKRCYNKFIYRVLFNEMYMIGRIKVKSAEKIQRAYKRYITSLKINSITKKILTTKIQNFFREHRRQEKITTTVKTKTASKIQNIFRDFQVKKKINNQIQKQGVLKIQSLFRNFKTSKHIFSYKEKNSVIKIQNLLKENLRNKKITTHIKKNNILKIQDRFRDHLKNKKINSIKENKKAEKIQKLFKNYKINKDIKFHTKNNNISKIQGKYRDFIRNKKIHSFAVKNQAQKIQHIFRDFKFNKKINSLIEIKSSQKILKNFKNFLLKKKINSHLKNNQVNKVQIFFRQYKLNKNKEIKTKNNQANKIQKYYKEFIRTKKINSIVKQIRVIKIQNKFKEYLSNKKVQIHSQNNNALKIQKNFLKYIHSKKLNNLTKNSAAFKLQRVLKLNKITNKIKRRVLLEKNSKNPKFFQKFYG